MTRFRPCVDGGVCAASGRSQNVRGTAWWVSPRVEGSCVSREELAGQDLWGEVPVHIPRVPLVDFMSKSMQVWSDNLCVNRHTPNSHAFLDGPELFWCALVILEQFSGEAAHGRGGLHAPSGTLCA